MLEYLSIKGYNAVGIKTDTNTIALAGLAAKASRPDFKPLNSWPSNTDWGDYVSFDPSTESGRSLNLTCPINRFYSYSLYLTCLGKDTIPFLMNTRFSNDGEKRALISEINSSNNPVRTVNIPILPAQNFEDMDILLSNIHRYL